MGLLDRLKHAWNAFKGSDPQDDYYSYKNENKYVNLGSSFTYRPDRVVLKRGSEKSIVGSIYTRIAIDCSSIGIKHVRMDDSGRYLSDVDSYLNNCLTLEANKDQTSRMMIRDLVISMFEEGNVALVPIDTTFDINNTASFDIKTMRVAKIVQWFPDHITVEVYNDQTGNKVNLTLPKNKVAIVENPLSAIMNEPNSTLQRLIHKLALLDVIDEHNGSGRLDLIIQLPYVIKTELRKKQAESRRVEIEQQLSNSKYGIAYTDGTEHITQLNRPIENNLMTQIQYLLSMLYSQIGLSEEILNGTADEKAMLNYMNRTIKPIMDSIVDELKRKFLTKTARSQNQSILYFNDPFRLVPVSDIADIADKFTRNEIMTSNEIRQIVGLRPVDNPEADELRNKNLNKPSQEIEEIVTTRQGQEDKVKESLPEAAFNKEETNLE